MSELNFILSRFRYLCNKDSVTAGDDVLHTLELEFTASRLFTAPNDGMATLENEVVEYNLNSDRVIDVSFYPLLYAEKLEYTSDFDAPFICRRDDSEGKRPNGKFKKISHVTSNNNTDEFEIAEMTMVLKSAGYGLEISLYANPDNPNSYAIPDANGLVLSNDQLNIYLQSAQENDLENKVLPTEINTTSEIEIILHYNDSSVNLGNVQILPE